MEQKPMPTTDTYESQITLLQSKLVTLQDQYKDLESNWKMTNRIVNSLQDERANLILWGFWDNPDNPANKERLEACKESFKHLTQGAG